MGWDVSGVGWTLEWFWGAFWVLEWDENKVRLNVSVGQEILVRWWINCWYTFVSLWRSPRHDPIVNYIIKSTFLILCFAVVGLIGWSCSDGFFMQLGDPKKVSEKTKNYQNSDGICLAHFGEVLIWEGTCNQINAKPNLCMSERGLELLRSCAQLTRRFKCCRVQNGEWSDVMWTRVLQEIKNIDPKRLLSYCQIIVKNTCTIDSKVNERVKAIFLMEACLYFSFLLYRRTLSPTVKSTSALCVQTCFILGVLLAIEALMLCLLSPWQCLPF